MQTSWMQSGMLTGDLRDNPQVRLMQSWFKPKENIPNEEIEVLQDNGRSGGLPTDLESPGPLFVSGNCFGYLSDQPGSAFNSDLELESEEERLDNEAEKTGMAGGHSNVLIAPILLPLKCQRLDVLYWVQQEHKKKK